MAAKFVYEALPSRVIFDEVTSTLLRAECERLRIGHPLILSTPQQRREGQCVLDLLGGAAAGLFTEAEMHTPVRVTERAVASFKASASDGTIAIGGGSTTGLGKAIALRTGAPQIVIPTTYAGSEMTPILGETVDGRKTTQVTRDVLPETVIYDVAQTLDLPPDISAASGLNAIAHAVEALYARDANPIVSMMAEEGVRVLAAALPLILVTPHDFDARSECLYGTWLCGVCLGAVGMALHHKLCHALGGLFDLPHAQTHAIVLPHALAYNAAAAPDAICRLSQALQADDPARAMFDLAGRLGISGGLRSLGMPADGVDRAADEILAKPYWNPAPIDRPAIRDLLDHAWSGMPPRSAS